MDPTTNNDPPLKNSRRPDEDFLVRNSFQHKGGEITSSELWYEVDRYWATGPTGAGSGDNLHSHKTYRRTREECDYDRIRKLPKPPGRNKRISKSKTHSVFEKYCDKSAIFQCARIAKLSTPPTKESEKGLKHSESKTESNKDTKRRPICKTINLKPFSNRSFSSASREVRVIADVNKNSKWPLVNYCVKGRGLDSPKQLCGLPTKCEYQLIPSSEEIPDSEVLPNSPDGLKASDNITLCNGSVKVKTGASRILKSEVAKGSSSFSKTQEPTKSCHLEINVPFADNASDDSRAISGASDRLSEYLRNLNVKDVTKKEMIWNWLQRVDETRSIGDHRSGVTSVLSVSLSQDD